MQLNSALELPSFSKIDPPTTANGNIVTNPRYKTQGMTMKQVYALYRAQFPAPASHPNHGGGCGTKNNGISVARMGMPQKFNPSADDSLFSQGRRSFVQNTYKNYNRSLWARSLEGAAQNQPINKTGIALNRNTGDDVVRMRKIKAMGGSTNAKSLGNTQLTYKNFDYNTSKDAARRCRSGGCVAPAKKGANVNFKSGGGSCC
ncbi:hypothetical protein KA005_40710 [bacterium]|nr:hypothetical protein [bacterium]